MSVFSGVPDNFECMLITSTAAFPPPATEVEVDIQDPWSGPREFAEDLYTAGDIPADAIEGGNPHVLPTEEDLDGV